MKPSLTHSLFSAKKSSGLRILAVDHDRTSVQLLEHGCHAILGRRLQQFASADSLAMAVERMAATPFDAVLLEPHWPNADGLTLLTGHPSVAAQTIVVSAHTELAVRAFEHGVLDFVPKPVGGDRLARALQRVAPLPAPDSHHPEEFIAVRHLGRIDLVPVDELLYVEGADKYSELVLLNGQRNFYDKCLGRVEAALPRSFMRIHKSFLVRFAMVARLHVQKGSRYFAELKNGLRLPVGRSHYAEVKSRML
jgi:DNA-binding LytR/AlgR family response regulator